MKLHKILFSITLLFTLHAANLHAKVMGHYNTQSGESYIIFHQLDFERKMTVSVFFDVEADSSHHKTAEIFMTANEYQQIFESTESTKISVADMMDDRHGFTLTASNFGATRTITAQQEMYNNNVYLGSKEITFTVQNGKIVSANLLVKKKKHVALFITLPGKFESVNSMVEFQQAVEGLGLSSSSTLDQGYALSDEAIAAALESRKNLAKYCELQCQ